MVGMTMGAYVRWFDSSITLESCSAAEVGDVCENESVGLLLKEDDHSITLALDHCLDTRNVRLSLCIPKVNVRMIRYLPLGQRELQSPREIPAGWRWRENRDRTEK